MATKKLYHCFRDEPKAPWDVWTPSLTVDDVHPDERERCQEYLDELAEYGTEAQAYYTAERPWFNYGPFVEVIKIDEEHVFRGKEPEEFIFDSSADFEREVFFNARAAEEGGHDIENPGYPIWTWTE